MTTPGAGLVSMNIIKAAGPTPPIYTLQKQGTARGFILPPYPLVSYFFLRGYYCFIN